MIPIRSAADVAARLGVAGRDPKPPCEPPLLVSEEAIDESAWLIARKFQGAFLAVAGPRYRIETWHEIGIRRRINWVWVESETGGGGGYYAAVDPDDDYATIAINRFYDEIDQCRSACHELAHHEVETWTPVQLRLGADLWRYEDQRRRVAERIAKSVVARIFDDGEAG